MVKPLRLNDRHQQILRATVQHYIATAEPVGSQTLVQEYQFAVSSATIRNALGQLEKAGLLYQPHVSAGRVPSDSGYRIYVDNLLTWSDRQSRTVKQQLENEINGDKWHFEALIQRMGQILAGLSGYIALITFPQTETVQLRHLQLMLLPSHQILIILVTDSYHTHSLTLDLPATMEAKEEGELEQELAIFSNFLNAQLRGKNLSELSHLNWQELDQKFSIYADFLLGLQQQIKPLLQRRMAGPLVVHGVSKVIQQPEFSQLEQVQMLLSLLEQEQEQLFSLLFDPDDCWDSLGNLGQEASLLMGEMAPRTRPVVTLRIGAENPLESMHPCTLVSAVYRQKQVPVGSVSILGPTRMVYQQTIPLVEQAAECLSEALSKN
ncbi:heat-inducible transcriptional repressor HrcA [Synechocystis sp. PCC 7339]|uniref:heat-inducible transcriptional repressor HrcA n=1 Tax=unclassified Synechocystis TaxID=2640012 RepID=UPI001BB062D6|nr:MULTISPECIES: heat-inducible transcriptional repressor HrcA [unclassified Synechocystis]QUS59256.1 heat-inducible transcriptional repressor HrcA [Synechocystis sp. PCC 7338]UAJ71443.1 heat-inducible transcriptional repressor HrcA [Synechocystis sp. PCC 7339]